MDFLLGDRVWVWLRDALRHDVSTVVLEPQPVHSFDREVEAASLYRQLRDVADREVDLIVAAGAACGPVAHAFADDGQWHHDTRLILLEPGIESVVTRFPEVRQALIAQAGPAAAHAAIKLVAGVVRRRLNFSSGHSADAAERVFNDLSTTDRQRQWARMMADATRLKDPVDPELSDQSGMGARVLDWYGPWSAGTERVEAWIRSGTGLARFADQQKDLHGTLRVLDMPPSAWINAPAFLASQIETVLAAN